MDTEALQKIVGILQEEGISIDDIEPVASCNSSCTSCNGTCQYCVSSCQRCNAGGQ